MKTQQSTTAKIEELMMSEMKSVNGGQWIAIIIDGKKRVFWLPE